jgi:hypothetical protein
VLGLVRSGEAEAELLAVVHFLEGRHAAVDCVRRHRGELLLRRLDDLREEVKDVRGSESNCEHDSREM